MADVLVNRCGSGSGIGILLGSAIPASGQWHQLQNVISAI
jgi:hypothetical protein